MCVTIIFRWCDRYANAKFIMLKLRHTSSAFVMSLSSRVQRGASHSQKLQKLWVIDAIDKVLDYRAAAGLLPDDTRSDLSSPSRILAASEPGRESDGDRMYSDERAALELWVGKMTIAYSQSESRWGGEENARPLRWVILRNRTGISSFRKAVEPAGETSAGKENVFRLDSYVFGPVLLRCCKGIRGISAFCRRFLHFPCAFYSSKLTGLG